MHENPWKTVTSRIAYENPWIRVREDRVLRPNGKPGLYGVVEIRPSVGVIALNDADEIVLVGQWRYTIGRHSIEIPRGGSNPDEKDMLLVAQRELAEEAGVLAANWKLIGSVDVCTGVADDIQHLFLATELSQTTMSLDPEEDIIVQWQPFEKAIQMVMDGTISEVCSVAGILKAARLRGK